VSAKRRADGPAVTRKPKPASGRSPSPGPTGPKGPGRPNGGGRGPGKGTPQDSGGGGGGKVKQRVLKILKWCLIAALVGSLLLVGAFVYLYKTTPIPNPNKDFQTQTSFVYYGDGKTQIGSFATQNRVSISYHDMSQHLRDAVVAAEDRTFWTNSGKRHCTVWVYPPRHKSPRAAARRRVRPRSRSST
jgi:hypothetical protein